MLSVLHQFFLEHTVSLPCRFNSLCQKTFFKLSIKNIFFLFLSWILYLRDTSHPWDFEMGLTLGVICYITNYPKTKWLKIAHIYYFYSCGWGIQHGVAGSFKVLAQGLQSYLKPRLGKGLRPNPLNACLLAAFGSPVGCCTDSLSPLPTWPEATLQSLLQAPLPHVAVFFLQAWKLGNQ